MTMTRQSLRPTQLLLAAALVLGIGVECGQAVGQRVLNELNRITGVQRTNRPTRTLEVVGTVGLNGFNRTVDSVDVLVNGRELPAVQFNVTRVPDPADFDEQFNYTSTVLLHDNRRLLLQTQANLLNQEGSSAGAVESQLVNVMPAYGARRRR